MRWKPQDTHRLKVEQTGSTGNENEPLSSFSSKILLIAEGSMLIPPPHEASSDVSVCPNSPIFYFYKVLLHLYYHLEMMLSCDVWYSTPGKVKALNEQGLCLISHSF